MENSYKLELIKMLTLLYRESEHQLDETGSIYLINKALDTLPTFDSQDAYNDTVSGLKQMVIHYTSEGAIGGIDKDDMLQRARLVAKEDISIFESIKEGIDKSTNKTECEKICIRLKRELKAYVSKASVKEIFRKAYRKLSFDEDKIDWSTFTKNAIHELESHSAPELANNHESFLGTVDFSDEYCIKDNLVEGKSIMFGAGIMRTGWQGLNKMLAGGFRRGEMIVVGGTQHGFKSGMLMNIPRQIALYNKPHMDNPSKKPLLWYISLENDIKKNTIEFLRMVWEMKHKKKLNLDNISNDELLESAKFLKKELVEANGYNFIMDAYDPSRFTYETLFEAIRSYENMGYEIHLISFDYLGKASYAGCGGARTDEKIRDLYSRIRNFCARRRITFLTAHQISSEGKNLIREGKADFVKEVANKGYYVDCRGIDHEVDVEIMIKIEKPQDGYSYLTMMRGKHRGVNDTPENDLYQVYRYEKVGGIHDDINGASQARKQVGGGTQAEGNTSPWYVD